MSKLIRSMQIPQMMVQKYERYLPTAFDESLSLLQKVNKVVEFLNLVINHVDGATEDLNDITTEQNDKISSVRNDFDELNDWARGEGLELTTSGVLDEWFNSGKLADIISNEVLDMKANQSEVDTIKGQIDSLIAHAGDTDGNAELLDIRVGWDGIIYPTAGDSVRSIQKFMTEENEGWIV